MRHAVQAMIEPSVLRAMLAAGATAEMIVAAVEADYAAEEKKKAVKRAQDAERQRKKRDRGSSVPSRGVTGESVSHGDGGPAKERPPHPQKKTNTPPNEAKASLPPKPVAVKTNTSRGRSGARLAQDWHPDETLWAWGKAKLGLGEDVLRFETGAFRDHFWGAPGQKGVKLDWNATWKNWMREAVRRRGRARGGSPANAGDASAGDEDWRKAVRDVEATRGEATRSETTRSETTGGETTGGGNGEAAHDQ